MGIFKLLQIPAVKHVLISNFREWWTRTRFRVFLRDFCSSHVLHLPVI